MWLIKNNVMIEWVELGEGLSGDYDPDDPDDIELLRFDVSKKVNGEWEEVEDASYCTLFPADSPKDVKLRALNLLMSEIAPEVENGHSVKRLCERMSWIEPGWVD